jgi:hypothetical protein
MHLAAIQSPGDMAPGFLFLLVILIFYFIPAMVAWGKRSFGSVMAINFFLGWTIVGWVVALAWALKDDPKPTQVIVQAPANPLLCSNCGKYSAAGSRFCAGCGNGLMAQ